MRALYMEQAQKMESEGSLLESEKLYLQVGEVIFCVSAWSSKHDSSLLWVKARRGGGRGTWCGVPAHVSPVNCLVRDCDV